MKKCKKIMTAQRYIDGELSDVGKQRFETHLAGCEECKAFCAETLVLKSVLAQKERVAPLAYFAEKVLRKASEAEPARRNEYLWETMGAMSRRFVPAAALLCCILFVSAVITLRSLSVTTVQTPRYGDAYYAYSLGTNEKAFLTGEDDTAAGHLFKALEYNVSDGTTSQ